MNIINKPENDIAYEAMWAIIKSKTSKTWGLSSSNEEAIILRALSSACKTWRANIEAYCWNDCNHTPLFTRIIQGHLSFLISTSCAFPRDDETALGCYQPQINTVAEIINEINELQIKSGCFPLIGGTPLLPLNAERKDEWNKFLSTIEAEHNLYSKKLQVALIKGEKASEKAKQNLYILVVVAILLIGIIYKYL